VAGKSRSEEEEEECCDVLGESERGKG